MGNTAIAGMRVKAAESHAESQRMRAVLSMKLRGMGVAVGLVDVDVDDLGSKRRFVKFSLS